MSSLSWMDNLLSSEWLEVVLTTTVINTKQTKNTTKEFEDKVENRSFFLKKNFKYIVS